MVLRLSHEVNLRQWSTDDCGAFRSLGPCSLPSSLPPGLGMTRLPKSIHGDPVIPQPLHQLQGREHRARDLKSPHTCVSHRRSRPPWQGRKARVLRLSHEVNLRQWSTDDCGAFRSLGPCSVPSTPCPGLGMTRLTVVEGMERRTPHPAARAYAATPPSRSHCIRIDPVIPQPEHTRRARHPAAIAYAATPSSRSHCTNFKAGSIVQGISNHRTHA